MTTLLDDQVVELCRTLLRFDTSNFGDAAGSPASQRPVTCERPAAEFVAETLDSAGLEATIVESAPGRASVIARIAGTDTTARPQGEGALLVHGHLDVVPASAGEWTRPPFAGEVSADCVWGRGAVDMKDMLAMMLAVLLEWRRTGQRPRRDLVFAFLADEEAGSRLGAHWLVDNRPDLFEGCTEAVSEVGGYSWTAPNGRRIYVIETAQKGVAWRKLVARGNAGHGSMPSPDNPVSRLVSAMDRIARYQWPVHPIDSTRQLLAQISEILGVDLDPRHGADLEHYLGDLARMVIATLSNTAVPTNLMAGTGSPNVIPSEATGVIDGRYLPGLREEFDDTLTRLAGPGIDVISLNDDISSEQPWNVPITRRMADAVSKHDPDAAIVPYCISAGTDNSAFARLGIRGYGFVPLRLPQKFNFGAMFHGVDERIPIDALRFGASTLSTFLLS